MDCSTVDMDISENCTVLSNKTMKAIKNHVCGECRKTIIKGEKYERIVEVFDGLISTHKTCVGCVGIRDEFFSQGWYYGNVIDDFREHVWDCSGDISQETIANLPTKSMEIVCDMLNEYFEDHGEE